MFTAFICLALNSLYKGKCAIIKSYVFTASGRFHQNDYSCENDCETEAKLLLQVFHANHVWQDEA